MVIPFWSLLVLWGVFVAVTVIFSLINLYHILHYGFWTFKSALFAFLYYGAVIIILFWAWQTIPQLDWSQPLFSVGKSSFTLPTTL